MSGALTQGITPDSIILTVAGTHWTFRGDGGRAIGAEINPFGVVLDGAGNLYLADSDNDRIRKVWTTLPRFVASPATLSFTASAGAPVVAQRSGLRC